MTTHCYAALGPKQPLVAFTYEPTPLATQEIAVNITHCGICHSDVHLVDNDWQLNKYPLVPGHEIIGTISTVGGEVKHLQVGQRVGIGWQSQSCGYCEWCAHADENLCASQKATCVGNYGGFADAIQINQRFAFAIPDALSSAGAAPLLCGGVTVYSPLKQYASHPNNRVGIIGIGGLGHMALQFANALGCEVTAFSSSPKKENEAKALGAHHFIDNTNKRALQAAVNSFDFILSTVTAPLDWMTYINLLRPRGKLCFVGGLTSNVSVPIMSLIHGRKSICGSNIGSRPDIMDMLNFAALHKIAAKTEVMSMANVNQAMDKVRNNQARYRIVLETNN